MTLPENERRGTNEKTNQIGYGTVDGRYADSMRFFRRFGKSRKTPDTEAPSAAEAGTQDAGTESKDTGTADYSGETLVVQVWGGTYEETLRNYIIPAFEKKTGLRLKS